MAKRELRRRMREIRRELASQDRRALDAAIVERLVGVAEDRAPDVVMVFTAVAGEPDIAAFASWCRARLLMVVGPAADPEAVPPVDPAEVDLFVVPGLAFDVSGHRLGQGGGWYDRFLAGRTAGSLVVGVAGDEQVVDAVPVDDHDVPVHVLVTPTRTLWCS